MSTSRRPDRIGFDDELFAKLTAEPWNLQRDVIPPWGHKGARRRASARWRAGDGSGPQVPANVVESGGRRSLQSSHDLSRRIRDFDLNRPVAVRSQKVV